MCNLPTALIKKDERQYKILYIDETLKNTKKRLQFQWQWWRWCNPSYAHEHEYCVIIAIEKKLKSFPEKNKTKFLIRLGHKWRDVRVVCNMCTEQPK